ncbi:MAG: hypothetical protein RLZZ435_922 [Cyanobacteriota bacterium]|jgi:hypothetical protein
MSEVAINLRRKSAALFPGKPVRWVRKENSKLIIQNSKLYLRTREDNGIEIFPAEGIGKRSLYGLVGLKALVANHYFFNIHFNVGFPVRVLNLPTIALLLILFATPIA